MDGSEIHEVILTPLALEKRKTNYQCFAPNIEQYHTINHLSKKITAEKRNVLTESARIVRGKIKNIIKCNPSELRRTYYS